MLFRSQAEDLAIVPTFQRAVGVRQQREPLMRLLKQNVYGELTPQEVLAKIEELARDRRLPTDGSTRPAAPSGVRTPQTSRP